MSLRYTSSAHYRLWGIYFKQNINKQFYWKIIYQKRLAFIFSSTRIHVLQHALGDFSITVNFFFFLLGGEERERNLHPSWSCWQGYVAAQLDTLKLSTCCLLVLPSAAVGNTEKRMQPSNTSRYEIIYCSCVLLWLRFYQ